MAAILQKIKTDSVKPNSMPLTRKVDTCKKLIKQYGMLVPPIVGDFGDGTKALISGDCEIKAAIELETDYAESMVVPLKDKTEGDKLSLMLMNMRASPDAVSEGMLINSMISSGLHNQTEIAGLLGRSASWVNKRLSLATRLEPRVREMVSQGLLAPQSAQEIARMPSEAQFDFSSKVVSGKIPKSSVEKLVCEYVKAGRTEELGNLIINDPAKAVGMIPRKPLRQMETAHKELDSGRHPGADISNNANNISDAIAACQNDIAVLASILYQMELPTIRRFERPLRQFKIDAEALVKIISLILDKINFPWGKPTDQTASPGEVKNRIPSLKKAEETTVSLRKTVDQNISLGKDHTI